MEQWLTFYPVTAFVVAIVLGFALWGEVEYRTKWWSGHVRPRIISFWEWVLTDLFPIALMTILIVIMVCIALAMLATGVTLAIILGVIWLASNLIQLMLQALWTIRWLLVAVLIVMLIFATAIFVLGKPVVAPDFEEGFGVFTWYTGIVAAFLNFLAWIIGQVVTGIGWLLLSIGRLMTALLLALASLMSTSCGTETRSTPPPVKVEEKAPKAEKMPDTFVFKRTVHALPGDGCIHMLKHLGVTDTDLGMSHYSWCLRETRALGRQQYWSSNTLHVESPRICLQGKESNPEVWSLTRHKNGDIVIEMPSDAPVCKRKD